MATSDEFAHRCLQQVPCGVLQLDDDGVIEGLNGTLEQMLETDAGQLKGHNQKTLPQSELRGLFKGSGLMHLVGPGAAQERWLQCSVIKGPGGSGEIKFFEDVTDRVRLQQQVERLQNLVDELTITDDLTGLANQRAFNHSLNSQVTRSRRYHNPLSLAVVELDDSNDPETSLTDDVILTTSRYLRDRLRWADMIARWDHNHFAVILPETNADDGVLLLEKICRGFPEVELPSGAERHKLVLRFGLSEWQKGQDTQLLMARAAEDLNQGKAQEQAAPAS